MTFRRPFALVLISHIKDRSWPTVENSRQLPLSPVTGELRPSPRSAAREGIAIA
jgi:hypothetical protein